MQHTIEELTTGQEYFVRVSAENELGYGKRRVTAPSSLVTPVQKPGKPTSFFNNRSQPVLSVVSATSLLVQIGPPVYDGGSPLIYFVVEWDTTFKFESSPDGSALGKARIKATHDNEVCLNCVTSFDLDSSILKYNGDYDTIKQLQPQLFTITYWSVPKLRLQECHLQ